MRFSLLSLFVLLTGICVALGIYIEHGACGLWCLSPHLLLMGVVVWLRRKRWKWTGWITVAIYLAAWAATWIIGIPDLEADVGDRVTSIRWSYAHDFGPFRRADYDPFLDR